MSELPAVGRRGFRGWPETISDLAAIEAAGPPLNRARVWWRAASGGVAETGTFAVAATDDVAVLQVNSTEVARLERSLFRGAWLSIRDGHYYLELDIGRDFPIQVSGPGDYPAGREDG